MQRIAPIWNIFILGLFLVGNVLTIVSLSAEILGLDLTPGFGMVQMAQLLLGISMLTLAGFLHLYRLRTPGTPRSLQADIGIRLSATGLVFAWVAGLSDLLAIGTHVEPAFERPYVGPLQLGGLALGVFSIVAGMMLFHTSRGMREASALKFLIDESGWQDGSDDGEGAAVAVGEQASGEREAAVNG